MPVSLQQFFNSANTVGDSASLFLQNGGESVGDTSSLHGIHTVSYTHLTLPTTPYV